jgi:hypothetical protein
MDTDQPTNSYPLVVGKDFAQFIQLLADKSSVRAYWFAAPF